MYASSMNTKREKETATAETATDFDAGRLSLWEVPERKKRSGKQASVGIH